MHIPHQNVDLSTVATHAEGRAGARARGVPPFNALLQLQCCYATSPARRLRPGEGAACDHCSGRRHPSHRDARPRSGCKEGCREENGSVTTRTPLPPPARDPTPATAQIKPTPRRAPGRSRSGRRARCQLAVGAGNPEDVVLDLQDIMFYRYIGIMALEALFQLLP